VAGLSPGLSWYQQLCNGPYDGALVVEGRRQIFRIARKESIQPDLPEAVLLKRRKLLAGPFISETRQTPYNKGT